jgi:beta-lactamase superfamily II metal-dependent hydrolase
MQSRALTPTAAEIGEAYKWGEVDASVLSPHETSTREQREDSVVMLVTCSEIDFLFKDEFSESAEQPARLSR